MNLSRLLCWTGLLLPLACGSSGGDDDDGSAGSGGSGGASGSGGAAGASAGRGGAAGSGGTGGSSSGSGGSAGTSSGTECERLAQCCELVSASDRATCDLAVQQSDELSCSLALAVYAADCPAIANPDEMTSDGWTIFSAYSDQSVSGFRQQVSAFDWLFTTSSGAVLGGEYLELYRSVDAGRNFVTVGGEDSVLVVGEGDSGSIFGLNEVNDVRSVVRSEDDGVSFQVLTHEMLASVDDLFVRGAETLYALAGGRVARSGDGGESFEFLTEAAPALELSARRLLVDEHETLYVFTDTELWRRHALDARWYSSSLPAPANDVAILPDNSLFCATDTALLRSTSYGDDWETFETLAGIEELSFDAASGLLFARTVDVHVSADRGATFQLLGPEDDQIDMTSFTVLPDRTVLAAEYGIGGELFQSRPVELEADPGAVTPAVRPASCYDGMAGAGETALDCGGECRKCELWERLPAAPSGSAFITSRDEIYVTANDSVYRSTDFGYAWEELGEAPQLLHEHESVLYALEPADVTLVSSSDWGETWESLGAATLPGRPSQFRASSVQALLLMTSANNLYASNDSGASWLFAYDFGAGTSVSALVELPTGELFAIASGALHRSPGEVTEWTALSVTDATWLGVHDGSVYVARQAGGISRTDASGANFEVLDGTSSFAGARFTFNSVGKLLLLADDGAVHACDTTTCAPTSEPGLARSRDLAIFSDDRLFANPFLSVATTDW
jgi:hypothetical protein